MPYGTPTPLPGSSPLPGVGYLLDEDRARRLAARVARERTRPGLGLTRAVVFLTNRCTMDCRYCRSLGHEMPPWTADRLEGHLRDYASRGARHVHWTGGEATVHPMLSRFVRFSTAAGMDNSISTNATASSETLGGLVDAGMSRFHVSLDTADEARFDYLTRTRGLLSRVRESLRTLCSLRDSGRRVAVVVNTVLGPDRIRDTLRDGGRDLGMLLDWLKQARVDDFKFVLDSSEDEPSTTRDELSAFYRLFDGIVPREFPMFHLRMQTLFDGGHGFRDDRPRHCFQCLDDRVTDSRAAYPCIARLREGGSPVFELDDPDEVKSSRLAAFLASDRSRDPLCRRCCFDLYRDMNERVAWLLENGPCSGN